jgi:hypothetical protein
LKGVRCPRVAAAHQALEASESFGEEALALANHKILQRDVRNEKYHPSWRRQDDAPSRF